MRNCPYKYVNAKLFDNYVFINIENAQEKLHYTESKFDNAIVRDLYPLTFISKVNDRRNLFELCAGNDAQHGFSTFDDMINDIMTVKNQVFVSLKFDVNEVIQNFNETTDELSILQQAELIIRLRKIKTGKNIASEIKCELCVLKFI